MSPSSSRRPEAQRDFGADGKPPLVAPFVVYNGHAEWNAARDLADWIAPEPPAALDILLGLQMRRRYILADLKRLGPEGSRPPPGDWFSVLAWWENARWGRDADRLARLWRTVLESGDLGIIRGFAALRHQLAGSLPAVDAERIAAAPTGRRRTMIRHEETQMAAQIRRIHDDLRQEGRRSLLHQMAIQKFGPAAAAEVSALFDEVTDPDRVDALAGAVIECETAEDFIARARGG